MLFAVLIIVVAIAAAQCPPAVFYWPDFLTADEAEQLRGRIYAAPKPKWTQLSARRLQNWGMRVLREQCPPSRTIVVHTVVVVVVDIAVVVVVDMVIMR